jgi:phage-related protein
MPRFLSGAVSVQVSLAASFNLAAMYTDGTAFGTGGFDGLGNAFSATLLGPGSFMGFPFTVGAPNVLNAVKNATIPLPPGQYSALLMVGAAVNGSQAAQTFTVTYADGSTTVFTQGIGDWVIPSSFSGEYVLGVMGYRNTSGGGRDSTNPITVYGYVFYLDGSKMPISMTLPANNNVGVLAVTLVRIGMELELRKQIGFAPIILLDIETGDGANFFWSDFEGSYPAVVVSGTQAYSPWVKSAGPFKRTRDLSTDTADLVVQNLSGNSISRDAASALQNHEFEGALCVVRLFHPFFFDIIDQFYYSLSEQSPAEDEVTFRLLQLFDTSLNDVAGDIQADVCTHRYKELACGSTGTATTCLKRFIDCSDASRAAVERHNAILSIVPNATLVHINPNGGGGGDNSGGGADGGSGGVNTLRG